MAHPPRYALISMGIDHHSASVAATDIWHERPLRCPKPCSDTSSCRSIQGGKA